MYFSQIYFKMSGRPLPWGNYSVRNRSNKHPPWVPPPASSSPTRSRGSTPPSRLPRRSTSKRTSSKRGARTSSRSEKQNYSDLSVDKTDLRSQTFDESFERGRGRAHERSGSIGQPTFGYSNHSNTSMLSPEFEARFRQGMETAIARTRSIPGGGIEMMSRSISPMRSNNSSPHRETQVVNNEIKDQNDDYQVRESDLEKELFYINSALKSHRERGPRSEHSVLTTPVGGGVGRIDNLVSPPQFQLPENQQPNDPKPNSLQEKIKRKATAKDKNNDVMSKVADSIATNLHTEDDDAPDLSSISADWKGLVSDMIIKLHNNNSLIDTLHQCDGNPDHAVQLSTTSSTLLKVLGYRGNHYNSAPQRCDSRRCLVAELSNTLL